MGEEKDRNKNLGTIPRNFVYVFGVAQTVFLVKRVFVHCQKGAVSTKTARMTNLHSNLHSTH